MNNFSFDTMVPLEHAEAAGVELTEHQKLYPDPRYGGRYLVTDQGIIFSLRRNGKPGVWELKQWLKKSGYLHVNLMPDREQPRVHISKLDKACETVTVHKVVATTFHPKSEGNVEIDHKNGDKLDNSAANLEWVTRSEQHIRAHRLGLKPGVGQFAQRRVAKIDPATGKVVKIYYSINQAAREDGHKSGAITLCCQGKQKHHHGCSWKYLV